MKLFYKILYGIVSLISIQDFIAFAFFHKQVTQNDIGFSLFVTALFFVNGFIKEFETK